MAKLETWYCKAVLPLLVCALILALGSSYLLFRSAHSDADRKRQSTKAAPTSPPSAALPLVGTATCSARGCHGSIEPVLDAGRCRQDEYVQWTHDRHADAYRTLFNERSQSIIRLLGTPQKAHEEPRCLACHTNPLLASIPPQSPFFQQEKLFGVGCESCHGSANPWLVAHTAADWRAKKRSAAMPDLTDPAVHVKACVGCHVGAPPDGESPLRDVNHDLIAAGHPRLNFEFGTYQANMPAHWRAQKKPEGHLWAIGQRLSAQASLELLAHRAKVGPWPEFAEYDCFACHHSLAPSGGRTASGRKPGSLPWGSWYFALTRPLAGELPALHAKNGLEAIMQQPFPDRKEVADQARAIIKQLAGAKKDHDDRKLLRAILTDDRLMGARSWDNVEQMYLALHALNQSQADPEVARALLDLTPMRAFVPGFDGPLSWQPKAAIERLTRLR